MSKMRVYEYAKKLNISSKEVIIKLKEMNIEVSNHMTMIEDDAVKKLDGIFIKIKRNNKPQSNQQQAEQKNHNNPLQNKPSQILKRMKLNNLKYEQRKL